MLHSQPDMLAVKSAAKAQFGGTPGVEGFGIGHGTLRIYVQNAEIRNQLPATFQGVPVDFIVSGDIAAYGSSGHHAT
jgi:hypothetical protein